nr:hypothetical protein [Tanacetum cinerariifolium]
KFLGTVKFGNDHVAKIMGYGDYQIGNLSISQDSKTKSWIWHRRLSHLNFGAINHLARQCLVRGKTISSAHGSLRVNACRKRKWKEYILVIVDDYSLFTWVNCLRSKDEALDFIIKFLKMIQVRLKQNGVVERRNRTLIEAACTMLIYAQALLFLWAEAVATACYTQNQSIIRLRHKKTPYELLHNKLPDLSFIYVFGALCYPTNDSEKLIQDSCKNLLLQHHMYHLREMTGICCFNRCLTNYLPLHQVLILQLLQIVPIADVIPSVQVESTGSPSSTIVDQDAPSPSKFQTTPETQSSIIPQDVKEDIYDIEVAHMGNDLLFGVPIPKVTSAQSSLTVSPHIIVQSDHQIPQHNSKWTKDHPLDNIIVDDITIVESERYSPDEYLHHFEPSQRYQVDSNVVVFIEPYERRDVRNQEKSRSLIEYVARRTMTLTAAQQVSLNNSLVSPENRICQRLPNQEFDAPPSDEEIVTFIKELGHKGSLRFVSKYDEYQVYGALLPEWMTNHQVQDSPVYKTYLAFATEVVTHEKARKFKKPTSPLKKKALVDIKEPVEKLVKKPAARRQSTSVQIKDTPEVPDELKGKSIEGTGLKLGVLDVSKVDSSESKYESYGYSDDDDQQNDDEFEQIIEEMYSDVNVELKDSKLEGKVKDDEEITNASHVEAEYENVIQEVASDQVKDNAQATVTAALATQKTAVLLQSSSILSNYALKFINFDNIPSGDTKIISMMDVKVQHKYPSIQTSPLLTVLIMVIPKTSSA